MKQPTQHEKKIKLIQMMQRMHQEQLCNVTSCDAMNEWGGHCEICPSYTSSELLKEIKKDVEYARKMRTAIMRLRKDMKENKTEK